MPLQILHRERDQDERGEHRRAEQSRSGTCVAEGEQLALRGIQRKQERDGRYNGDHEAEKPHGNWINQLYQTTPFDESKIGSR